MRRNFSTGRRVDAVGRAVVGDQAEQPARAQSAITRCGVKRSEVKGLYSGASKIVDRVRRRDDRADQAGQHVVMDVAALEHRHDDRGRPEVVDDRAQRVCRRRAASADRAGAAAAAGRDEARSAVAKPGLRQAARASCGAALGQAGSRRARGRRCAWRRPARGCACRCRRRRSRSRPRAAPGSAVAAARSSRSSARARQAQPAPRPRGRTGRGRTGRTGRHDQPHGQPIVQSRRAEQQRCQAEKADRQGGSAEETEFHRMTGRQRTWLDGTMPDGKRVGLVFAARLKCQRSAAATASSGERSACACFTSSRPICRPCATAARSGRCMRSAARWPRRATRTDVFTTNVDGPGNSDVPLGTPVDLEGVQVTYFPSRVLRRLYWSPPMRRALFARVAELRSGACPCDLSLADLDGGARGARARGVPYVVSPRGMLVPELIRRKNRWIKQAWIRLIERPNLEHAAAIHTTSAIEAHHLGELRLVAAAGRRPSRTASTIRRPHRPRRYRPMSRRRSPARRPCWRSGASAGRRGSTA